MERPTTIVKAVLRKCGLIRSTKFFLPPEIWIMVLSFAIEPTIAPYRYCNHDTFPQYRAEHSWWPGRETYNVKQTSNSNDVWAQIRLVCRAWVNLAGPRPFFEICWRKVLPEVGVRSISCLYVCHEAAAMMQAIYRAPELSAGVTSLTIAFGDYYGGYRTGVGGFLSHAIAFPTLRTLRIADYCGETVTNFWARLERGFPNLISLNLDYFPPSRRTFTFKMLEILITWDEGKARDHGKLAPTLRLPRLRYCALKTSLDCRQLFLDHGHQLESLSLGILYDELWPFYGWQWPHMQVPLPPADFWHFLPQLLTLEISAVAVNLMESLPDLPLGHPLRQLVLLDFPNGYGHPCYRFWSFGSRERGLHRVIAKFPTIQHLSIAESMLPSSSIRAMRRQMAKTHIGFDLYHLSADKTKPRLSDTQF